MDLPKRKKLRLCGYDYSQNGAYFVTICTKDKAHILGELVGQGLCSCRLSPIGEIVEREINNISTRFDPVQVDKYVIMPNHIHVLLTINTQRQEQSPCPTTGDIICALKSLSTKAANAQDHISGRKIWQSRYYDHIVRNEEDYLKIWQYIDENPLKWEADCFY